MRFENDSEPLPFALRLGSAWRAGERWTVSADLACPRDNAPYVALGNDITILAGEYSRLAFRAGANSRNLNDIQGLNGVTFGFGYVYGRLSIDYGFVPLGILDDTHRLSFSLNF
jgi:hypothetical protein